MHNDNTTDKSDSASPADDHRTEVLRLAYAAKMLAWSSGERVPPDALLIRAAMAYVCRREKWPRDLDVLMIAAQFDTDADAEETEYRRALIGETLPNPSDAIAEMVAANRRVLGLPPQADELMRTPGGAS